MNNDSNSLNKIKTNLEIELKDLLYHFVKQIPYTTVSYSQLLSDLLCLLTIELNKLEEMIKDKERRVDVFTCTIFENHPMFVNELKEIFKAHGEKYSMIKKDPAKFSKLSEKFPRFFKVADEEYAAKNDGQSEGKSLES